MTRISGGRHAHKLVVETAEGMAHEMFDKLMGVADTYDRWKKLCPDLTPEELEKRFVAMMTPKLLDQARAILAGMLTRPGEETLKHTIHQALILDNSLTRGRRPH